MKYTFSMFSAACGGLVFLERERERERTQIVLKMKPRVAATGLHLAPPPWATHRDICIKTEKEKSERCVRFKWRW
jgi:hypothetical protein